MLKKAIKAERLDDGAPTHARNKGRPKLKDAAEIDSAIRNAAIQVLLEHGEAATLNAVALASGLTRKSVYARYASKAELFIIVIKSLLHQAQGVAFEAADNIEERLFNYIYSALDVTANPQSQAIQRLLTVNPTYIAALKAEMLTATHTHFFVPLQNLLTNANQHGELVVDDVEATAKLLIKLIFVESVAASDRNDSWMGESDRTQYARRITKLFTRGLLPRK